MPLIPINSLGLINVNISFKLLQNYIQPFETAVLKPAIAQGVHIPLLKDRKGGYATGSMPEVSRKHKTRLPSIALLAFVYLI